MAAYSSLVEMIGRAFYDDNHGLYAVILDYFARKQCWFNVVEVAENLKLGRTRAQEALAFLEGERLLIRKSEQGSQSYVYALNYSQIHAVVSYKLQKMRESLEQKHTIAGYICPTCDRRYTALDAAALVSDDQANFLCEVCRAELILESERHGGGPNFFKDLQEKMEVQLHPIMQELERVRTLSPPELKNPWRVKL